MIKTFLLFCILAAISQIAMAQKVWSSANGTLTFTKTAYADWKQAANQDRISDSVWITRASTQSLFNIRKDTAYATGAPSGTMWALGKTDSFATHSYKTFVTLSNGSPQGLIGKDLVLHLLAENIYLDIKIISYAGGNSGGGFSYVRASGSGATAVVNGIQESPASFALEQNYPNPFNPSTTIGFTLDQDGLTTLKVYDNVGREAAELVSDHLRAGVHYQKQFDGQNLVSGVYFVRLVSGSKTQVMKIILMK